jgi:ADP-ribose pyrophosphatase
VDASGLGGIHGLAEEGEDIRATVWTLTDALALLDNGKICNSMTLIAMQWLAHHHANLAEKWLQDV